MQEFEDLVDLVRENGRKVGVGFTSTVGAGANGGKGGAAVAGGAAGIASGGGFVGSNFVAGRTIRDSYSTGTVIITGGTGGAGGKGFLA